MTATYATPAELARFLNIAISVPSARATGTARPDEEVGTGDNTTTVFYFDHSYLIPDTYNVYYGSSSGTGTALTETTDYSVNKETGTLTLTTAGVTAVGTTKIWANYKYNDLEITDTQLQEALDKAQDEIDDATSSHWATGSDATPDWGVVTDEKHSGKGRHDRDYYLLRFPLPDISTVVGTAIASGTTIWADTAGFPSSGYICIESEKITYTGKTGTAFTGVTGLSTTHPADTSITPVVVEVSTTESSSTPSWSVLEPDTGYDIDLTTGRVHVYNDEYILDPYGGSNPPKIPNRVRFSYLYGYNTISDSINHLCLMIASKHLIRTMARRSLLVHSGKGAIDLINLDIDEKWIEEELQRHKSIRSSAL